MNFTRNSAKWFPPIITSLILFAVMEFLVRTEVLNPSLFPSPLQILASLDENKTEFLTALMQTTLAVVAGFSLSIVFGLTLAILFSLNSFLRRGVLPFAIFFQTVPIIAIAPLLVIYFGFGISTVIAAAMIVSIFPIIANALVGLSSAPRDQADLFKIYKASAVKTLLRLQLPSAYLSIYTGLKVSAGLAVIGAVAGEFVAGGGLGALIDSARTQQRIDLVFAAILLLSLLGLALILAIELIHWGLQKWRPLAIHLNKG